MIQAFMNLCSDGKSGEQDRQRRCATIWVLPGLGSIQGSASLAVVAMAAVLLAHFSSLPGFFGGRRKEKQKQKQAQEYTRDCAFRLTRSNW